MRVQTPNLPNRLNLPRPERERWQPLRSGLVNLYRYDREEFVYHSGRLLLRGNNGTGKSRVLALQLPFLLDGEVNPERLEPDADPSRKIEWNLLMGRYPDRVGYTWIEFGRCDDGNEHYITIGCGLSAVEGKSGVQQWFFITSQRIGKDLELVSDSKQVLGIDRLRLRLGLSGRVFEDAASYRSAVNAALFQLDEDRYASLVNLLIQLRRPQLTRRLEEHELSSALSEALPPVSFSIIENVAEAFSELQSDRSQLDSSRSVLVAVDEFLVGYRRYVEVAARRLADRVLASHDEYEAAMQGILTAEAECDRALAELSRLKSELQRLSVEENALQATIAAFHQSPNSKGVLSLEHAHREAAEKRRDAEFAEAELADAIRARKACTEEHLRAMAVLDQRQLRLTAAVNAAAEAAKPLGLEDMPTADELVSTPARDQWDKIDAAVKKQFEKMEELTSLNERVVFARGEWSRSRAERDQISGLMDDARERLNIARDEHQSSVTSFLAETSAWTADLTELPLPFDEPFLRSVAEWCDRPSGPNPFEAAIRKSVEVLNVSFAENRAYLKQLEKSQTAELNRLESELQTTSAEAQDRLDNLTDSIQELDRREATLRSEAEAAPSDYGVRAAWDYSIAESRHLDSLRKRMAEAEEAVSQKQRQFDPLRELRDQAVKDLGIAGWASDVDDLQTVRDGIEQYRLAVASLWAAQESFLDARAASEWARTVVEQAASREARQKEVASQLDFRAAAAEIQRDTAGQAVDATTEQILDRVAQARQRLEALRIEEKEVRRRYHDTEIAVTRVDERLRSGTAVLHGETDRRDVAASSLRSFASTGLLRLVCPEIDDREADDKSAQHWSTARIVEVAFDLASRWANVDAGNAAWEYHQKSVPSQFTALMQALSSQGWKSSAVFRDDVLVASVTFAGQELAIEELQQILFDDVSARQALMDTRAREILENHLSGKLAVHLGELLHAAEEQVRQMNIELDSRPMSTGMKLRFVWRPADAVPAEMAEARRRLVQRRDDWSPTERRMLGAFLQRQIEDVYSNVDGGSWLESLAAALDYRRWHSFGVERFQDGEWKRLTQRTYGTGSGGEKAIALTLPHFAAAAAFYRTAGALAPRLILLDEAFVGIDADMRAKCMGLIHTFDLDFVMTSEREWGCYQTLPGLAIYQLSTRPEIDAIGLTRWVWNGRQRSLSQNTKRAEALVELSKT